MSRWLRRAIPRQANAPVADPLAERRAALASMYDAHVEEVYRFVHRRCRDQAMAEDITQETFFKAVNSTDDPGSLTIGWLLTVARHQLVDALRRQSNYDSKLRLVAAACSDADSVDLLERLRIEAALDQMSIDHRLVLSLRYIDDLPVSELADHLGRSTKSVEGLITRARRELRARLDESVDSMETGGAHG